MLRDTCNRQSRRSVFTAAVAIATMLFVLLVASMLQTTAASAVTEGWSKYGSCEWRIDNGELVIRPENNGIEATLPSLDPTSYYKAAPWLGGAPSVTPEFTSVRFEGTVHSSSSCANMFYNCGNLKTIDFTGFDLSNARNIRGMFQNCSSLTELDTSAFNGVKFTNTSYLFRGCSKLESLDVSGFDTSNVTNMFQMFSNCSKLASLDVSGFNTSKVTVMSEMFSSCNKLTSIDVSHFDTSNVTVMSSMFSSCSKLTSIDVSKFDTSKVTSIYSMFSGCSSLTSLDVSHFDTSKVTNMQQMFFNCSKLTSLDLSHFDTSNVTRMNGMFYGCNSLTSLDVSGFDTSEVTKMDDMFSGCRSLTSLDISAFDTPNVTDMRSMFYNCSNLTSLDISAFDTSNVTSMGYMFDGCTKLKSVDLANTFSFKGKDISSTSSQSILPSPPTNTTYTGKWIRDDEAYGPYTPTQLRNNYSPEMAGTWVWQEKPTEYTVTFDANGRGMGDMGQQKFKAAEDAQIPPSGFSSPTARVAAWAENPDGSGHRFAAGSKIPAGTFSVGDAVTLYAQWEDIDSIRKVSDGVYEVELKPGTAIDLSGIPAATAYRVFEETADGWTLVDSSGTGGYVEPLATSTAAFSNAYTPETASVQLFGSKTLDNRAAEAGSFSFELLEGDTVLQTVPVSQGGAVVFDPIVYDGAGEHTYTVREVAGTDRDITYDLHEEQVGVSVTRGDDGKLRAVAAYDSDGIRFSNKTAPGSVRLTKEAVGSTQANADDEFEFTVTLRNPNGEPEENAYLHYERNSE